jgi:hypothetical protein
MSDIIVGDSERGPMYEGIDPDAPVDPELAREADAEIEAVRKPDR